jgi:hypothetical protein
MALPSARNKCTRSGGTRTVIVSPTLGSRSFEADAIMHARTGRRVSRIGDCVSTFILEPGDPSILDAPFLVRLFSRDRRAIQDLIYPHSVRRKRDGYRGPPSILLERAAQSRMLPREPDGVESLEVGPGRTIVFVGGDVQHSGHFRPHF